MSKKHCSNMVTTLQDTLKMVYSATEEEHFQHKEQFWKTCKCRNENNVWKMFLGKKWLHILAYKMWQNKIILLSDFCKSMKNFEVPHSQTSMLRLERMVHHYQQFVPHQAYTVILLTNICAIHSCSYSMGQEQYELI